MPRCWRRLIGGLSYLLGFACTSSALAHGFGQRYDLPIPLAFYVWGAGAMVALSFVGLALFLRQEPNLPCFTVECPRRRRLADAVVLSARALAVGMLILVTVAGFFGSQDPIRNIAPVLIWIVGWVGTRVSVLVAGRPLGAPQSLEHGLCRCREFLSPHACGWRAGSEAGLSRLAWSMAGVRAFRLVRLDGAGVEREECPRGVGRRPAGLFRTDLARHVCVRTRGMARPRRGLYARLRDICALRSPREDAGGPGRHLRAAAGGWLARGSSLDDLDGRAGDCPAGDRHIRRFSRNAVMGGGRFRCSRLGIRLVNLDSS